MGTSVERNRKTRGEAVKEVEDVGAVLGQSFEKDVLNSAVYGERPRPKIVVGFRNGEVLELQKQNFRRVERKPEAGKALSELGDKTA